MPCDYEWNQNVLEKINEGGNVPALEQKRSGLFITEAAFPGSVPV